MGIDIWLIVGASIIAVSSKVAVIARLELYAIQMSRSYYNELSQFYWC